MQSANLVSSGCSFLENVWTARDTIDLMLDKYAVRGEKVTGETVVEGLTLLLSVIGMAQAGKGILSATKGLGSIKEISAS